VDTDALQKSAAAEMLLGALVDESELSDIEATCGLDPVRDLSEILVWVRGTNRETLESFGVQLEGRSVDAQTIAECHASLVNARGKSVVRIEATAGPLIASEDQRSAIAVADDRTVVAGSVQTVAEAMAVRRGLLPALAERESIASLWPELRRDAALAAIIDVPDHWRAALERVAPFDQAPTLLDAVETIAAAAKTGAQTTVTARIDTANHENATDLAERLRQWFAAPPDAVAPPWSTVLESGRVGVEGNAAVVTLDVSALRPKPVLR
jgi:hypothetical protein